jgi:hypothetical protein
MKALSQLRRWFIHLRAQLAVDHCGGVMGANRTDPWAQTVTLLSRLSMGRDTAAVPLNIDKSVQIRLAARHPPTSLCGDVRVLERLSERTVAVSWRDSTRCHYDSQIWRIGWARYASTCAVSGGRINIGDAIYRPIGAPINAAAMICAETVNSAVDKM